MSVNDGIKPSEGIESPVLPESPVLLSEHVRRAVKDYISRLDGEEIGNLYNIVLNEVERPLIETVLELCGQNQSKAAQMLGVSRSTLRKKLSSYTLM